MGVGLICHCRRQWGKRASRGSGSPPRGGRTRSRSILQRNQFWTSMSGPLDGRVLPPRGGLPDPLEARFPHCLRQWQISPTPIPLSNYLPPIDPSCDPVLESIQVPLHPRGEYPRIRPEQQYRLRHRFIKMSRHFRICPLPAQYSR